MLALSHAHVRKSAPQRGGLCEHLVGGLEFLVVGGVAFVVDAATYNDLVFVDGRHFPGRGILFR